MLHLVTLATLISLIASGVRADDTPDRAAQLKAVRANLSQAAAEFRQEVEAGTVKPDDEGEYPAWIEVSKRFVQPTRAIIEADPADAVGLEALLFALGDLDAADADLYAFVLKHHAGSEKIKPLLCLGPAPTEVLRNAAKQSPHVKIRLRAAFHLADREYHAGKAADADKLLEDLQRNPAYLDLRFDDRWLGRQVEELFNEVRNLNVGDTAPEVTGEDLDGKPLKLSDSRGKVTLLVFWASRCRPCLDMVPHQLDLIGRYAGRPFAIVGVNGDLLAGGNTAAIGPDGKPVDGTAKLKAAITKHKIAWRSFRYGLGGSGEDTGTAGRWNVRTWPTVYLLDKAGVIRGKWKGAPPVKGLDAAVEAGGTVAEAK